MTHAALTLLAFNLAATHGTECADTKRREVAVRTLVRAEWWAFSPRGVLAAWPERLEGAGCSGADGQCRQLTASAGSDCPVTFNFVKRNDGSLSLASFVVVVATPDRQSAGVMAQRLWEGAPMPRDQCPTPGAAWGPEEVYRRCSWETSQHLALVHVRIDGFQWGYAVQLVLSRRELT